MLDDKGLVYLDKQYKLHQEEFESIKQMTRKTVIENTPNMSLIQVWKTQIRRTLIDVKKDFNEWIDTFTNKFVKSLNKIEHSKELSEFAYFDKHLTGEVLKLQDEYKNILSIYEKIANSPANEKIEMYEQKTKEMREIEQRVISRNKEIKSKSAKLSKLLRETVELDGLGLKVFQKYTKFLQHKV